MKVYNYHSRLIDQPKERLSQLFKTLTTKEDEIWPIEKWPAMRFKEGLKISARGGHGPIRYTVLSHLEGEYLEFRFTRPLGFHGTHKLELIALPENQTKIQHTIQMNTSFFAHLQWLFIIRPIHDALVEEAFDKLANKFHQKQLRTRYSIWVHLLRKLFIEKKSS